ncbi:hypothetical protein ACF1B0_12845 [Streptomyces anandii]|uniref:hypothetical protein n=1 Tax=Streptomyces anandii TaxID=285454 RepID=UPI0036F966A7
MGWPRKRLDVRSKSWDWSLLPLPVSLGISSGLVFTAYFLGRFGLEDVSEALAYTGHFTGLAMLVAAVVVLLGAGAVLVLHWWRNSSYAKLFSLMGTVTALLANLMLLVATVREGESPAYLLAWSVLAAISAAGSYMVLRTSVPIPAPKSVGIVAAASAAVAVANFGYNQLYQPYRTELTPILHVAFGKPVLSPDKRTVAVPINVTLENRGNVGIYILANQYTVFGFNPTATSSVRPLSQWREDVRRGNPAKRWEVVVPPQMIAEGRWSTLFGEWLGPNDTSTTTRVIELPTATAYDYLSLQAEASVARRDRMWLESDLSEPKEYSWLSHKGSTARLDGQSYVKYQTRIHENNSIAEHTRDPRYITVWWEFGDRAGLRSVIAKKGGENRTVTEDEAEQLQRRYGFVRSTSNRAITPFWNQK